MEVLSGEEFKAIRNEMGFSLQQMADWLYMTGKWTERTIRRWEAGENPIPGAILRCFVEAGYIPESVAIKSFQEAKLEAF